jgi:hypothetical protein
VPPCVAAPVSVPGVLALRPTPHQPFVLTSAILPAKQKREPLAKSASRPVSFCRLRASSGASAAFFSPIQNTNWQGNTMPTKFGDYLLYGV